MLAQDSRLGDKQLVAYVVAERADAPPDAAELRRHVAEALPAYMVPVDVCRWTSCRGRRTGSWTGGP
ncbi:hypothetical protein PQR15_30730 [Streptomyces lydicus]|nr:hypothetical protein [Streptomyces lydicus]